MSANPFPGWLAEVAADEVVVRPDDVAAEARGNLWTFGLDAGQRAAVTPAEAEAFVRAVAVARSVWLAARRVGPMRLYCWHDEMAGQLRLSLVTASGAALPFSCQIDPAAELSAVVRSFLGAGSAPQSAPLPVWVAVIPRGGAAEPPGATAPARG